MEFHLLQMSIKAMCAAVRPTMTEYVKKYRVRINLHATVCTLPVKSSRTLSKNVLFS